MIKLVLAGVLSLLASLATPFATPMAMGQSVKIPKKNIKGDNSGAIYYVVSIGINRYQDSFWPDLKWPEADSRRIAKSLGDGAGMEKVVLRLQGDKATTPAIRKTLGRLSQIARAQDVVVVYLSGHGTLAQSSNGQLSRVFVTHDTKPGAPQQTGLPHSFVSGWLENLPARRKLVIYATCHSGVGKSKLPPKVARLLQGQKGLNRRLEDVSEGSLILSASAKNEVAREDDRLKADIYTHFLLEALDTYDRNRDGMVTASEAHDYAKEMTFRHTEGRQRPTADMKLIGAVKIPLGGRKTNRAEPVFEAYDKDWEGFQLAIEKGAKGRLPLAFPLKRGANVISILAPNSDVEVARYRVTAGGGDIIGMDDLLAPPPLYLHAGYAVEQYGDETFEKLSGSNQATYLEPELGVQWQDFTLGVQSSQQSLSHDVSALIKAETKISTVALTFGYRYQWRPNLHLGPILAIGQSQAKLRLKDTVTDRGDTVSFDRESLYYHGGVRLIWSLVYGIRLHGDLLYRHHNFDFNPAGNLEGDRFGVSLGLGWEGFGKGMRL